MSSIQATVVQSAGTTIAVVSVLSEGQTRYFYGHAFRNVEDSHMNAEKSKQLGEDIAVGRAMRSLFQEQKHRMVEDLALHLQNKLEGVDHA